MSFIFILNSSQPGYPFIVCESAGYHSCISCYLTMKSCLYYSNIFSTYHFFSNSQKSLKHYIIAYFNLQRCFMLSRFSPHVFPHITSNTMCMYFIHSSIMSEFMMSIIVLLKLVTIEKHFK